MPIDIDSLTIGEAKRLAALFGASPSSASSDPPMGADRIGKVVLVRSRGSGVWQGTLCQREVSAAGHSVYLRDARRLWSWEGAAECSQLAVTGPRGGKIGVPCHPIVREVLEEHEASEAAIVAVNKVAPWQA